MNSHIISCKPCDIRGGHNLQMKELSVAAVDWWCLSLYGPSAQGGEHQSVQGIHQLVLNVMTDRSHFCCCLSVINVSV